MTAHKPRDTGPLQDSSLIEILFSSETTLRSSWWMGRHSRVWRPPTDVFETEEHYIVQVEVAGVHPDDFRISMHDRVLSISGARPDANTERRAYYQMEVNFGEFRTDVELPGPVIQDKINAEYSQGFLRVTLPKPRPDRVKID